MTRTPLAHACSATAVAVGVLLCHEPGLLIAISLVLFGMLLLDREGRAIRRSAISLIPIALSIVAVDTWLARSTGTGLPNSTLVILRLFALMLAFSHLALFFLGPDSLQRLVALGLRGQVLIVAVSAMSTLPLFQRAATQIVDARFAAGLVKDRSVLSTARQLPHVIRPLLIQALRTSIARADTWRERRLVAQLLENVAKWTPRQRLTPMDWTTCVLAGTWLVTVITFELR